MFVSSSFPVIEIRRSGCFFNNTVDTAILGFFICTLPVYKNGISFVVWIFLVGFFWGFGGFLQYCINCLTLLVKFCLSDK